MKKLLAALVLSLVSLLSAQIVQIHTPQPQTVVVQPQATNVKVAALPVTSSFPSPLGIGLFPPLQFPRKNDSVSGIRLSILGASNAQVEVLDMNALVGITDLDFTGLALAGLWNKVGQNANALQIAGLFNTVGGAFTGIQIAAIANINGNDLGTEALQIACYNQTGGISGGLQIGVINQAKHWSGLQIGVINVAENLNGLQIGLANIIKQSDLPFMLLLNAAF